MVSFYAVLALPKRPAIGETTFIESLVSALRIPKIAVDIS